MPTSPHPPHTPVAALSVTEERLRRAYGASRVSRARRTIVTLIAATEGAFTVEDLHGSLAGADAGIGLATVYRAVAALIDTGFLATVGKRAGVALYARCGGGEHHHHLVCTGCGTIAPIDCPLDAGLKNAARRSGYTITGHEVVLYGLCTDCGSER